MANKHIVKSYDDALELFRSRLVEMGRESLDQITKASQALLDRDDCLAEVVMVSDEKVNVLQQEVEELGARILATRQPMAQDLRHVISGLKIASELERIADYAANIASYIADLDVDLDLDQPMAAITGMTKQARNMLMDIMKAFASSDIQKAVAVWHRDDEIDRIYGDLLNTLHVTMAEDSDHVVTYSSLIFIAKCCERIGDHITNIAENVHYIEHGKTYIDGKVPLT